MLRRLSSALADPDTDNLPDPATAADLALEGTVLRALSGPYLSRADRLQRFSSSPGLSDSTGPSAAHRVHSMGPDTDEPAEMAIWSGSGNVPNSAGVTESASALVPVDSGLPEPVGPSVPALGGQPVIGGEIPLRTPGLLGRADVLDALDRELIPGAVVTLVGMGGVGKTAVAAEYVHRHPGDFELIWWINAEAPGLIRAGLRELAGALGLPGRDEAIPAVRAALRSGVLHRRWLLVFDNADYAGLREFLPRAVPGCAC